MEEVVLSTLMTFENRNLSQPGPINESQIGWRAIDNQSNISTQRALIES